MDREEADLERRARVNEIEQHLEWEHEGTLPRCEIAREDRDKLERLVEKVLAENDSGDFAATSRAVLDAVLPSLRFVRLRRTDERTAIE